MWTQGSRQVCLFPVPEILEFVAFRDSGKIFQLFFQDFPGVFLKNPRTDPGNSHSLPEFSEIWKMRNIRFSYFSSFALKTPSINIYMKRGMHTPSFGPPPSSKKGGLAQTILKEKGGSCKRKGMTFSAF